MNERIIELAKQSLKDPDGDNDGLMVFDRDELKKFAEFILNDIDGIIFSLYHAVPLEQSGILLTLDENIKEHFYGVEEENQKDVYICQVCGEKSNTTCGFCEW
jgi:hypothetical protein